VARWAAGFNVHDDLEGFGFIEGRPVFALN
jgi:hypothetical protein